MRRMRWILAVMLVLLVPAGASAQQAPVNSFGTIDSYARGVIEEMRYTTHHNFIGRPIKGYRDPVCILTREALLALKKAQRTVRRQGYTLKVYDCYRPQRAVDDFVAWGKRLGDQRMKPEFYPRVDKRRVFKDGYIATKSGHSRGSTVDLTLVKRPAGKQERYRRGDPLRDCARPGRFRDNSVDMGTGYDCFDPKSHPFAASVTKAQRANRLRLRRAMLKAGFKGLETEWWHFTLRDEPFPDTYWNFPVSREAVDNPG
jgi:D-alanyl-D-alanine dipeptidase